MLLDLLNTLVLTKTTLEYRLLNFVVILRLLISRIQLFWLKSYRCITDNQQWDDFKTQYLPEVTDFPLINFDTEALYVVVGGSGGLGFVRSFDLKELAYNDEVFVVVISNENSIVQYARPNEAKYWINVVKVNKSDFPEGERDWLMIPEHTE